MEEKKACSSLFQSSSSLSWLLFVTCQDILYWGYFYSYTPLYRSCLLWLLPESSTSILQSMQQADKMTSDIIWLPTVSLVPFHPFSYLAVTAHLGLRLLQFCLGSVSLTPFWVWLLPLRRSCPVSPFYYSQWFLADCCSSCYSCCTLFSWADAALQGYDSCCQLFLVWKGCHAFCFDLTILRSTPVFNRLYFLLHLGYNHFSHHRARTVSPFQLHSEDISTLWCNLRALNHLPVLFINELSRLLIFLYIFVALVKDETLLCEKLQVWRF